MSSTLRRRFRIARRNLGAALLPRFAPGTLARLSGTWRYEFEGTQHLEAARKGGGFLVALWHGRMLVGLPYHGGQGWSVLVSPSDDGSLMHGLLDRFGYGVVRGSTSRGGARALRELLGCLRGRGVVVITPDGPRGPRHSMNPGLAWMSMRTGFPIVPFGFAADRAWRLSSWDAFTIPKPRARVGVVYGEPLQVGRGATPEELARATEALRERLMDAERRAFEAIDAEPDL